MESQKNLLYGILSQPQDGLPFQVTFMDSLSNGDLLNLVSPRTETKEIAILNILGKEVFKTITLNDQIHLPNLMRGIYIVKLKQGNHLGLNRLVVP